MKKIIELLRKVKFIDKIFENIEKYNSWQSRYERSKKHERNNKARKYYHKRISEKYSDRVLSQEEQAIIYSQAYQRLLLKDPTAAEFEDFDDYEVKKTEYSSFIVKGYCIGTNSYGARTRESYELEVYNDNDQWTCITDVGLKYLKWFIWIGLLTISPTIIFCCSTPSYY